MTKSAIRLLTLTICATALVGVATVTPASSETSHSNHVKKHKKILMHRDFGGYQPAGRTWIVARPPIAAGAACPGMGRSFDCAIWPPPMDEDPDRKTSGSDGS
jgi:hypothetical protein